jgi:hypothetical protein
VRVKFKVIIKIGVYDLGLCYANPTYVSIMIIDLNILPYSSWSIVSSPLQLQKQLALFFHIIMAFEFL